MRFHTCNHMYFFWHTLTSTRSCMRESASCKAGLSYKWKILRMHACYNHFPRPMANFPLFAKLLSWHGAFSSSLINWKWSKFSKISRIGAIAKLPTWHCAFLVFFDVLKMVGTCFCKIMRMVATAKLPSSHRAFSIFLDNYKKVEINFCKISRTAAIANSLSWLRFFFAVLDAGIQFCKISQMVAIANGLSWRYPFFRLVWWDSVDASSALYSKYVQTFTDLHK